MSQQIAFWRPDTCGCEFRYEWDSEAGPPAALGCGPAGDASAQPHVTVTVTPCKVHEGLSQSDLNSNRVVGPRSENFVKNNAWRHALETVPSLTVEVMGDDGEPKQVQRLHRFLWAFDENRKLQYAIDAGLQAERDAVATKVAQDFPDKAEMKTKSEVEATKVAAKK